MQAAHALYGQTNTVYVEGDMPLGAAAAFYVRAIRLRYEKGRLFQVLGACLLEIETGSKRKVARGE